LQPSNAVSFGKKAFTKSVNDKGKEKETASKSRTTAAGQASDYLLTSPFHGLRMARCL